MLFEEREITLRLVTDMLGTVPMSSDIYSKYIETKRAARVEVPGDEVDDIEADTVMDDMEKKGWTGFHTDEKGLFVYDYFVKGFIKNAGNIMKDMVGIKNLRSKLNDFVFVLPRKIHLGKDAPDSVVERPLRAMTAQGPRVSLARSSSVNAGTELTFSLRWLPHKEIKESALKELFGYGEMMGLGQFRNGGYGRFEVVSWKKKSGKAKA